MVSPSDLPSPLILVVDDFVDGREMYAEYLSFLGFRVAQAGDGNEAIFQAIQLLPDAIIMDLALPGTSGWEATRRLRQDPRTSAIPIIALSGHSLPSFQAEAFAAGCDAFVAKPCMPGELEGLIRRLLAARSESRGA